MTVNLLYAQSLFAIKGSDVWAGKPILELAGEEMLSSKHQSTLGYKLNRTASGWMPH